MTDTGEWQEAQSVNTPDPEGWQEVESEMQIIVEVEGDGWQGRFMGMDPRNANGIIQAHFQNATYLDGQFIADNAFVNATRDLEAKLRKVPVKSMTRCQWVSSMDTGHESGNKMRVFKVQWR